MLRVKELAQQKNLRLVDLIRGSGLSVSVVRRLYHQTSNAQRTGEMIDHLSISALQKISKVLGCSIKDLFAD